MSRKTARETAMKLLYEIEINKNDVAETIEGFIDTNKIDAKDETYIREVISGVLENKNMIDERIQGFSETWKINRLAKIDLSIMRISIYEILFRKDIPESVSVNEAVEIAKKYSTSKSPSYVNGLLGAIIKQSEKS